MQIFMCTKVCLNDIGKILKSEMLLEVPGHAIGVIQDVSVSPAVT